MEISARGNKEVVQDGFTDIVGGSMGIRREDKEDLNEQKAKY